jgi:FkbM family methyltransferase
MIRGTIPGQIIQTSIRGQQILFFVHNPADIIQEHHSRGEFYEPEELAIISKHVDSSTHYVDIGANIGNHIIYLHKFIGPQSITAIEPNPIAITLLRINLLLNNFIDMVDLSLLGYGLSNQPGTGMLSVPDNNLGGTKIVERPEGELKLISGDELLKGRDVDFIKVDVEGMEIQCLQGLENIIANCRPKLFIEVHTDNEASFLEWCQLHQYVIKEKFRRYADNENFLIIPDELDVE